MKRLVATFALLLGLSATLLAGDLPDYTLEGNGTGAQGTYLVKVSIISKDKKPLTALLSRCAVHGVLFRGFSSKEMRQAQKPLAGSAAAEAAHADYFKKFFEDDGPAKSYAEEVAGSRSVVKEGKRYRVTAVMTVNKEQLRKDLEDAGVIKGLNSIF